MLFVGKSINVRLATIVTLQLPSLPYLALESGTIDARAATRNDILVLLSSSLRPTIFAPEVQDFAEAFPLLLRR